MATTMMDEYKMMGITPHQNNEMKSSQVNLKTPNNMAKEDIHLLKGEPLKTKTKLPTIEQLAMLGVTITEIAEIYGKTKQTIYQFVKNNEVACYGTTRSNQYNNIAAAVYSLADFVLKNDDKWEIDTDVMVRLINSFGNNVDESYVQMLIRCIMEHKLEIENTLHKELLENTRDFVMRDIDVCDFEDTAVQILSNEITKKNSEIEKLNSKIKDLESILEKQAVSVTPKVDVHQNYPQKLDVGLSIDITVNGKKIDIK